MLLAAGIDPAKSIIFLQSDVHEHAELCWLLSSVTKFGELRRMTQFKDKAGTNDEEVYVRALQLPGVDGGRHPPLRHRPCAGWRGSETARRTGPRHRPPLQPRYGESSSCREADIKAAGARIMSLEDPARKMSKSDPNPECGDLPDRRAVDPSKNEAGRHRLRHRRRAARTNRR